jgi:hypothetical protein
MAMQRYKVKAGQHIDRNLEYEGKNPHDPAGYNRFTKGDVVLSDRPLDQIYVNKFEKVVDYNKANISESRKADVARLLDSHDSSWVEDDRYFLENMDDKDFARILRVSGVSANPAPDTPHVTPTSENKKTSPLGDDVTEKFPRAVEEGLKVFCNAAGAHQVTKPRSTARPLNPHLLKENEVDNFIKEYLEEK